MPGISISISERGFLEAETRLAGVEERLGRAPNRIVKSSADVMVDELRLAAPKRTGAMAAEVYAKVNGAQATFFDRKFYTRFVLKGTKPHEIWAHGDALAWAGIIHPVRVAHHPGMRADRFNLRAFAAALPRIKVLVAELGRWILGL